MIDSSIDRAIRTIENTLEDPSRGLPEELFLWISEITPLVNVDLLIVDQKQGTLLTWRPKGNYDAGWHLPGGILRVRETFSERLEKVALEELGVGAEFSPKPIAINQLIHPTARTRVHFISLLYEAILDSEPDEYSRYTQGKPMPGQWMWHRTIPKPIYQSQEIYREFLE